MTPEQLREHAKEWDIDGRYSIAEIFRAHADALEKLKVAEAALVEQRTQMAFRPLVDALPAFANTMTRMIDTALAAIREK